MCVRGQTNHTVFVCDDFQHFKRKKEPSYKLNWIWRKQKQLNVEFCAQRKPKIRQIWARHWVIAELLESTSACQTGRHVEIHSTHTNTPLHAAHTVKHRGRQESGDTTQTARIQMKVWRTVTLSVTDPRFYRIFSPDQSLHTAWLSGYADSN